MKVRVLKDFVSPVFGNLDKGALLDLDDRMAANWIGAGLVELVSAANVATPDEVAPPTVKQGRPKKVVKGA